jgi:hypothetical protein
VLVGIGIFAVCNVVPAKQDYDWASDYISRATANGWQLVYIQRNAVDITKPWQLFNPPPRGLYFVDWETLATVSDGRSVISVLSARHDRPPTETFRAWHLFDCNARTHASALLDRDGGVDAPALLAAERRPVPKKDEGNAIVALLDAVCAR